MPETARSSPAYARGDARPRIHVWTTLGGYRWSNGPTGFRSQRSFSTVGDAVNAAFCPSQHSGGAVVIVEAADG